MPYLRVELHAVYTSLFVAHRGYYAVVALGNEFESDGQLGNRVAVAHKYVLVLG